MSVYERTIRLANGETVTRWCVDFFHHGKRIRRTCGPGCHSETRAKAIEVQERLKLERQGSRVWTGRIPSLKDAAEQFLESAAAAQEAKNMAANTLRHYRNAWHAWLAPTPLARMRLDRITSGIIREVEFPGGPFTSKNARQCLGHILRWCAEEKGYIIAAPRIRSTRVAGRKIRITPEIESQLRLHMKRDCSDIFTLMLDAVMRNCEVFAMQWSRIDWERRQYAVARSKSAASERTIPLSERALAMLKGRRESNECEWVFPSRIGRCGHVQTIAKQFREARAAAGIDASIKLYCARHTGASELSEMGVDLLTLRELLGHEDISTTNKYLHGSADGAREAINSKQRTRTGLKLEKRA
jgi:integrase